MKERDFDIFRTENTIAAVEICDARLIVTLQDGRTITAPLHWFPWFENATEEQRADYEIMGWMAQWNQMDEGISIEPLLLGLPKRKR
jgi:hypothetical protein